MQRALTARLSPAWAMLVSLFFALLSFAIVARAWFDHLIGGHGWRQGDWLINLGEGFVRRGLFGEALIRLSDATGIPLLALTQIVQVSLFVLLVFLVWLIALGHRNRPLMLLLAASPGFFLIFWAGDLQGTMRKEVFGYLALALLTLNAVLGWRSSALPVLSLIFYTLGCIGNVMHCFMLPGLLAGLWLTRASDQITRRQFTALAAVATAMSILWLGLALIFREVEALDGLCAPLMARGLDAAICQDALRWLILSEVDHIGEVIAKLTADRLLPYSAITLLVLAPVALSFTLFREKRGLALLTLIALLPMLPLYAIATDWGRWISIAYTSYMLLLLQADATGRLTQVKSPSRRLTLPLLALALLISHEHTIGWQPGGAARSVISTALDFR